MPETGSGSHHYPMARPHDSDEQLTAMMLDAVQTLPMSSKADFLLETSIKLIEQGRYDNKVERYLDAYLGTPNLSTEQLVRALLIRGNARKKLGERLKDQAHQDFQAVLRLDPTNQEIQQLIRQGGYNRHTRKAYPFSLQSQLPPEIWHLIASHIPRYHLRAWLFLSSFHRDIAHSHIFRTLDIYFGSEDPENLNRGLDIFDRVKEDRAFANRIKSLRLHWGFEESDTLDLMMRIFRSALPEFTALREFEWIGYPELRAEIVQIVLASHPQLTGLGLIGWHFDAINVSSFTNLRKFCLRAEDDDGFASLSHELPALLTNNLSTLKHLTLSAYLARDHSWDPAFYSPTIQRLQSLDLVDTRISQFCLTRIMSSCHALTSLTLHGLFEDVKGAQNVFSSDDIVGSSHEHTFLPLLQDFRFVMQSAASAPPSLYESVLSFLKGRKRIRRLDLGACPWRLLAPILPGLTGLKVLGVVIDQDLTPHPHQMTPIALLTDSLPRDMKAMSVEVGDGNADLLPKQASHFSQFRSLTFLHLKMSNYERPLPSQLSAKRFADEVAQWYSDARHVALQVPSLDFVGWKGEHWVVVRPCDTTNSLIAGCNDKQNNNTNRLELKELPAARRKLDCAKGVDLGGDDVAWLEKKDIPVDYEVGKD